MQRRRMMASRTGWLVWLFVAPLTSWGQSATANEIGAAFVSANYALTENHLHNNFTTHRVDDWGISFGFILPIVKRTYGLSYKGRVAFHGVEDIVHGSSPSPDDATYYRNLDHYVSSLNEFMVGRRFKLSERLVVHPMLGAGVLVHIIWGNGGHGLAYGSIEMDGTAQLLYRFGGVDVGLQLSLEYVPWDTYFEPAEVTYMTLGVVIAK